MATTTGLMTVEQFRSLPETRGDFYYELHHGELVKMTRPKPKHWLIQQRITRAFLALADPKSVVGPEFAFRALPEYELRCADVAYLSAVRVAGWDIEDDFPGAPDIVVEVLSPSNTASEVIDKETLCLENGCLEFWVIDPTRKTVKVSKPDQAGKTFRRGDKIPLPLLGGATFPVDAIFETPT
jgi:Uma2 family endonuclease